MKKLIIISIKKNIKDTAANGTNLSDVDFTALSNFMIIFFSLASYYYGNSLLELNA